MKRKILSPILIFLWTLSYSQTILNNDCNTDFFTTNEFGLIQKWSLLNNNIIGGDTILTGGGTGLAFCGDENSPTFYCTKHPESGITYFDNLLNNWVEIPLSITVNNNGGHKTDQYFLQAIFDPSLEYNVNRVLYHFDGTNLEILDSLSVNYFSVFDIAVDTLGQAWVFEGNTITSVTKLKVYNSSGLITSYDITFNSTGMYGSFFLRDTLFIGAALDHSIMPVLIDGNNAQLGIPIPFPYQGYYDMASCQSNNSIVSNITEVSESNFKISPNPTNGILYIESNIKISKIEVFDLGGKLIKEFSKTKTIDLSNYPNGIYFLKIISDTGFETKKIIKQ